LPIQRMSWLLKALKTGWEFCQIIPLLSNARFRSNASEMI